jgi:hypothetical protein
MKKTSLYEKAFIKSLFEKLNSKKHDAGDYIDDFKKSKAPQFKGKSKKKKREMAIAAYLNAKEEDENTVGGGVLGPAAATGTNPLQNTDFYASGDYRKPKALGAIQTRRGSISKRRKKKKQK